MPSSVPEPGKPVAREFYSDLLDRWDALVQEGAKNPAKQIAGELATNPATVRGLLYRGRRYLGRENLPIHRRSHCPSCSCYA